MITWRKFRAFAYLSVAVTAVGAAPTLACTIDFGRHKDSAHFFAARLRSAEKVHGEFVETNRPQPEINSTAPETQLVGPTVIGVVKNKAGRLFPVEFVSAGLSDDFACGIFRLPQRDATGLFYLKRSKQGRYRLLHWQPIASH